MDKSADLTVNWGGELLVHDAELEPTPFQRPEEPEIVEQGRLIDGADQDILRRDIAVDELVLAGEAERLGNVESHAQPKLPGNSGSVIQLLK